MKVKLTKEKLIHAYEMLDGKRSLSSVAYYFRVTPKYLMARIRRCEKFGLGWIQ